MVVNANLGITVQKDLHIQGNVMEASSVTLQGLVNPKETVVQVTSANLRQAHLHLPTALVVNVHLDVTALKAPWTPYPVALERIMEVTKQLTLMLVCFALMAPSAIPLVWLHPTGSVRLDTTVQLDSR